MSPVVKSNISTQPKDLGSISLAFEEITSSVVQSELKQVSFTQAPKEKTNIFLDKEDKLNTLISLNYHLMREELQEAIDLAEKADIDTYDFENYFVRSRIENSSIDGCLEKWEAIYQNLTQELKPTNSQLTRNCSLLLIYLYSSESQFEKASEIIDKLRSDIKHEDYNKIEATHAYQNIENKTEESISYICTKVLENSFAELDSYDNLTKENSSYNLTKEIIVNEIIKVNSFFKSIVAPETQEIIIRSAETATQSEKHFESLIILRNLSDLVKIELLLGDNNISEDIYHKLNLNLAMSYHREAIKLCEVKKLHISSNEESIELLKKAMIVSNNDLPWNDERTHDIDYQVALEFMNAGEFNSALECLKKCKNYIENNNLNKTERGLNTTINFAITLGYLNDIEGCLSSVKNFIADFDHENLEENISLALMEQVACLPCALDASIFSNETNIKPSKNDLKNALKVIEEYLELLPDYFDIKEDFYIDSLCFYARASSLLKKPCDSTLNVLNQALKLLDPEEEQFKVITTLTECLIDSAKQISISIKNNDSIKIFEEINYNSLRSFIITNNLTSYFLPKDFIPIGKTNDLPTEWKSSDSEILFKSSDIQLIMESKSIDKINEAENLLLLGFENIEKVANDFALTEDTNFNDIYKLQTLHELKFKCYVHIGFTREAKMHHDFLEKINFILDPEASDDDIDENNDGGDYQES